MQATEQSFRGTCHCGRIKFELSADLTQAVRCNCSICQRKGTPMLLAAENSFKLIEGAEFLTLYQFNTMVAKHYFCKICGIYTHHNPRSNPALTRVNVGCLEGVDPLQLETQLVSGKDLSSVAE